MFSQCPITIDSCEITEKNKGQEYSSTAFTLHTSLSEPPFQHPVTKYNPDQIFTLRGLPQEMLTSMVGSSLIAQGSYEQNLNYLNLNIRHGETSHEYKFIPYYLTPREDLLNHTSDPITTVFKAQWLGIFTKLLEIETNRGPTLLQHTYLQHQSYQQFMMCSLLQQILMTYYTPISI